MPRFDELWGEWPIQAGRWQARVRWWRMGVEHDDALWVAIHRGLSRWLTFWADSATKRSHVPYLDTWLERRNWEDHPVAGDVTDTRRAVAYLKEIDSE
jgi:hypothetical protein